MFRPTWPATLSWFVAGRNPLSFALAAILVGAAYWQFRRSRTLWACSLVGGGAIAVIWIIGPVVLWPKYFLWLVPALALAVAVGVARSRVLTGIAVVLVLSQGAFAVRAALEDPMATRAAATIIDAVATSGGAVCASYRSAGPLRGYTDTVPIPVDPDRPDATALEACDVVVTLDSSNEAKLRVVAEDVFDQAELLPATAPGWVFHRAPRDCVLGTPTPACWR